MTKVYLIGSLRNPEIPEIANEIEQAVPGITVFDDWFAAGPEADDKWKEYEAARGRDYTTALDGFHAWHVFNFDLHHLETSDAGVLALPAGRSGHLELGWLMGMGKPGFILLDDPERWDVMYRFATGVYTTRGELYENLSSWAHERDTVV